MNFHGISKKKTLLPGRVGLRDDHGESFVFKSLDRQEIRLPLDAMHELFYCIKPNTFQGMYRAAQSEPWGMVPLQLLSAPLQLSESSNDSDAHQPNLPFSASSLAESLFHTNSKLMC